MKTLSYLIIFVVAFLVIRHMFMSQPDAIFDISPVQLLDKIAASFPKQTFHKSSGSSYPIINISYDVKKTDSLVNPMIGYINFTEAGIVKTNLQFVFHWKDGRWHFVRMLCRDDGADWSDSEIMEGSPLKEFVIEYQ